MGVVLRLHLEHHRPRRIHPTPKLVVLGIVRGLDATITQRLGAQIKVLSEKLARLVEHVVAERLQFAHDHGRARPHAHILTHQRLQTFNRDRVTAPCVDI